ncbi:MAG: hypothetical protein JW841_11970 [Deltaproteobacteria bacterium]|nr:hypothetical protein [Deltaproteobacteria bacterium]
MAPPVSSNKPDVTPEYLTKQFKNAEKEAANLTIKTTNPKKLDASKAAIIVQDLLSKGIENIEITKAIRAFPATAEGETLRAAYSAALNDKIGDIPAKYVHTMQEYKGVKIGPAGNESNSTIDHSGCTVTGFADILSTILDREITPADAAKYADAKGLLTKKQVQAAIAEINETSSVNISFAYWDKADIAANLAKAEELPQNATTTTYLLIGGDVNYNSAKDGIKSTPHWVVATGYSIAEKNGKKVITYEAVGTSQNDDKRSFSSEPHGATEVGKATINKIYAFTVTPKTPPSTQPVS